jgi:predicted metal-dependent hydrolase
MDKNDFFDPRNDRLARDIRNNLARTFVKRLDPDLDLTPVRELASQLLTGALTTLHKDYINDRLQLFQAVKKTIRDQDIDDDLQRSLVLWDKELFFETHEVLEKLWMKAEGTEKLILQALIRAAGYFIHLGTGNQVGAEKMAARAYETLSRYRREAHSIKGLGLLLECLHDLKTISPKLR